MKVTVVRRDGEIDAEKISRLADFISRHDLWRKFREEDSAGSNCAIDKQLNAEGTHALRLRIHNEDRSEHLEQAGQRSASPILLDHPLAQRHAHA